MSRRQKRGQMEKVRVFIDTDLGDDTDDAAALMLALACPEIEVVGITTVFKDTKKRKEMVEELLALHGRADIPVYAGHGRAFAEQKFKGDEEPIQYPLYRRLDDRPGRETGSSDDRAGKRAGTEHRSCLLAEDFLLQKIAEFPDLTVLSMGPMTNLAMACMRSPELMEHVRIIGMGGAFLSSAPEWNIACDPEAADIVMRSCRNLTLMGLDVTKYLKIDEQRLTAWKARKDLVMDYYLKGVELFRKATGFPVTFHDVLLVAYLMDPDVVRLKKGDFAVELAGTMTRGTMVDISNYYDIEPEIHSGFTYAVSVDLPRFFGLLDRYF